MSLTEGQVNAKLRELFELECRVYAASELRGGVEDELFAHFEGELDGVKDGDILAETPQYLVKYRRGHVRLLPKAAALRAAVDSERSVVASAVLAALQAVQV